MMRNLLIGVTLIFTGLGVKAYLLDVVKAVVLGWVWLYTTCASERGERQRLLIESFLHDEIAYLEDQGYTPAEIAVRIIGHWVRGLPSDAKWGLPFYREMFGRKLLGWSDAVRYFRTPKYVIPTLATLGIMNWAYYDSQNGRPLLGWFGINAVTICMAVLIFNYKRPLVRRILNGLFGTGILSMIGFVVWMTVRYRAYELHDFWAILFAMAALSPVIVVVDKSWRTRLFRGRWWLVIVSWVLIFAASLGSSQAMTGGVKSFFEVWAFAAILVVSMLFVVGIFTLATGALWHGGIKGTAAGLRLISAGLQRRR
jgi:hypothetical protein